MKTYLVGGAVRDQLLGLPVKERDWVVVGATPEEMLAQGFKPVGKDFPVFLHPKTHEEYALARTERKTAKGYKGFVFHASSDVTLKDDLRRRDLTINAMAQSEDGAIIDPYGGKKDLKDRILRHVSPAFAEDPVRILRVARFSARFPEFRVHTNTVKLMQNMVKAGEVDALVSERVWQECEKAMSETKPIQFFEVVRMANADSILFPELNQQAMFDALKNASTISANPAVRFAAMCYHSNTHDIKTLCKRLHAPRNYRELALLVIKAQNHYQQALQADAKQLYETLKITDAFRRPKRFEQFLFACMANTKQNESKKINKRLIEALQATQSINTKQLQLNNLTPQEIAEKIASVRIRTIDELTARPYTRHE